MGEGIDVFFVIYFLHVLVLFVSAHFCVFLVFYQKCIHLYSVIEHIYPKNGQQQKITRHHNEVTKNGKW